MVQFGHEDLSFEDAIKKESERISNEKEKITKGLYSFTHQHHTYLSREKYLEQLKRYFDLFPKEHSLIIHSRPLAQLLTKRVV